MHSKYKIEHYYNAINSSVIAMFYGNFDTVAYGGHFYRRLQNW